MTTNLDFLIGLAYLKLTNNREMLGFGDTYYKMSNKDAKNFGSSLNK